MFRLKIEGVIGWDIEIGDIRKQLAEANGEDVVVDIASPGGMISEGLLIYNELKNYQGNVDAHLTGAVASMASYIAMVGQHRTAENNAVFMVHNGITGAVGDYRLMFKVGNYLDSLTNIVAKEYALKSETDLTEIRTAMDETTFYYGDEIRDAGFVHEMVGDAEPEDKAEAVAMAELMIDECQSKINTPEMVKKDMMALATMLVDDSVVDTKLIPDAKFTMMTGPEMKITGFDSNAKLKDESWSKSESETRWRNHVGVKTRDDLPNAKYDKRFVHITDSKSLTDRNLPIFDYKAGEFVNIAVVRNGLARLPITKIPGADKLRVKSILTRYLDKFKKQREDKAMNLDELKEKYPELYKEIVALGLAEGVDQERARVKMLVEMRAKFPMDYSQKVIDQAIAEGHSLDQVTINLLSAEQVAKEVEKAKKDEAIPPPNSEETPEMKDGVMTHPDHLDAVGTQIAALPGVM